MSGQAQRRVLSLALTWVLAQTASLYVAGSPLSAGSGRGAARWNSAGVGRLRPPAAMALNQGLLRPAILISSFPAKECSVTRPARIRGRAGQDSPGISSFRQVHTRGSSLPFMLPSRSAGELTTLLPSRLEAGRGTAGETGLFRAKEVKRRPDRDPLSAGRP